MAIKKTLRDGVRYYEHATETMPDPDDRRKRRPMRIYYLRFRHGGKVIEEAVGPENIYPESEVIALADELKKNRKDGTPPFTLGEKRQASNEEYTRQVEERKKQALNTYDTFFVEVFLPEKRRQLLEGSIKQKYYDSLLSMHEKHLKPIVGDLTFDRINKGHFNRLVETMRAPVTKSRKERDYDAEDAYAALPDRDRRKKRFYKTVTATEPLYTMKMVQSVKALAHEVWKQAVKAKLASVDFPGEDIASGIINNARTRYFTPEEVNAILDDLKRRSIDVYHYSVIAAFSGLRISSILKLTWGALQDQVARDTKNKENVPVGIFRVVERLQEVIEARREMYPNAKRSDYLFPRRGVNKKGEKIEGMQPRGQMTKTFRRCLEDLRINVDIDDKRGKGVFHTLRHSYASWLVQKNMSLEKVADLLGHKTLQMTQRYKHLNDSHYHEAGGILNNIG